MSYDPIERRRPMNFPEACKRARELWGVPGTARVDYDKAPNERMVVGTIGAEPGARLIGRGSTWEEAFEDAMKKGAF